MDLIWMAMGLAVGFVAGLIYETVRAYRGKT